MSTPRQLVVDFMLNMAKKTKTVVSKTDRTYFIDSVAIRGRLTAQGFYNLDTGIRVPLKSRKTDLDKLVNFLEKEHWIFDKYGMTFDVKYANVDRYNFAITILLYPHHSNATAMLLGNIPPVGIITYLSQSDTIHIKTPNKSVDLVNELIDLKAVLV